MMTVSEVCDFLAAYAPPALAAEWDNVGLLVGDRSQKIERVLTCLTATPPVVAEAIRQRVDLIVTHHPLPFQPLKRLTADQPTGRILLDLIRAGIAVYSPHTAFDSASAGINQRLAEGLGLTGIAPLVADTSAGRYGDLPADKTLGELAARLKQFLAIGGLHCVGSLGAPVRRVAVACGSAGEFLSAAAFHRCQVFVTGETRLHTCYEAEALGIALLLAGHYASERFAVERLAEVLSSQFPTLTIWPSNAESDPLTWV